MDQSEIDAGIISALILRMEEFRLPRAQRLLVKVDAGSLLSDRDIRFLKRVYKDSTTNKRIIERNPGYSKLMAGFIDLYAEIISKAFENEKNGQK